MTEKASNLQDDGGTLPGELPADLHFETFTEDAQRFVNLKTPGDTFTGAFIRLVEKGGDEGLKYPGFLFAEYPSGALKVLPANWSIGEEIARAEREGVKVGTTTTTHAVSVMQVTLAEVKENPKDGTSVKLYRYGYAHMPTAFPAKIQWDDVFKKDREQVGK